MFLCCGDALFDLFVISDSESSKSESSTSRISLNGDVGGSPLNVAAGLARLGHRSLYFSKLSTDLFGQRIRRYMARNNIDNSLSLQTDRNSTLAMVEKNKDGSARYVFYTNGTADLSIKVNELPESLPEHIRVLHFGSYSTAVDPTGSTLANLAKRESVDRFVSYDPNLRPSIEPDIGKWRETFHQYASAATLVKASDEDIESLLGKNKEDQFVSDCFELGAELIFITRGADGASGFARDGELAQCEGQKVKVVDTVGAGDTFQAALLHYLVKNKHITTGNTLEGKVDLNAILKFAVSAAAITCARSGADLPYLIELSDSA